MEMSSIAKLSSSPKTKSFSSFRSLLCCQANKEDLSSVEYDNKPFQLSPQKQISDFTGGYGEEICLHGRDDKLCVACCLSKTHSHNMSLYGITKDLGNLSSTEKNLYENLVNGNILPDALIKTNKFGGYVNDLYCKMCDVSSEHNNNNNQHYSNTYKNCSSDYNGTNTKSTSTNTGYINSAVENDDDTVSMCSSCFYSNCEQCYSHEQHDRYDYEENFRYNNGVENNNNNNDDGEQDDGVDTTEFSFYSNQNFDSQALSRLLQTLDKSIGISSPPPPRLCQNSDVCNDSFTCCCYQGEECGGASTDTTGSTEKSRNDKDSGVGRTDESTKNDESSEQDVECTSPGHNVDPDHHCSNDSFTSNENDQKTATSSEEQLLLECNNFREALETRCNHRDSGIGNGSLSRIDSQSSIEREIDALNKEMEQIQIECQQIYEAHRKDPHKEKVRTDSVSSADAYKSPSRSVPRMGTRLEYIRQLNALQQDSNVDPHWVRHEHCTHLGSLQHPTSIILPLDSTMKDNNTTPTNNPTKHSTSHFDVPFPNGQLCNGIGKEMKDSSTTSAYNTGESSRSTPLTLELTHIQNDKGIQQPLLSLSASVNNRGTIGYTNVNNPDNLSDIRDIPVNGVCESVSRTSQTPEPPAVDNLDELYSQYAEVMYTNQANLQHTMMVQQRLFQQKILQQQLENNSGMKSLESSPKHSSNSAAETVLHASPNHHLVPAPLNSSPKHMTSLDSANVNGNESGASNSATGVQMEWVVKRRADGTRYITRRPMRSKFLKERARKISEERSGMTTDDDAMSELKCGRYWTKEDRKRHLEKAKEYKKRKQEMFRRKMETLKEIEEKKKEPNILELSHKKMMKHKNKKQFDDFTTVQEMLVHGSRSGKKSVESSPSKVATSNPLLSVTTV